MSLVEPAALLVGLAPWILDRGTATTRTSSDEVTFQPTPDCKFAVAWAASPDAADSQYADVPVQAPSASGVSLPGGGVFAPLGVATVPFTGTAPLVLRVRAEPTKRIKIRGAHGESSAGGALREVAEVDDVVGYWEATAYFIYEGQGVWKRLRRSSLEDETNSADLFAAPTTVAGQSAAGPFVYTLIAFFLSRVRDRTTEALKTVQGQDPERTEWVLNRVRFQGLKVPPVEGGKLHFERRELTLDNDCRVLEIKGFKAPALLSVCWPISNHQLQPLGVAPFLRAQPMESLLFFHASFGQNAPIYNRTPYPFGLDQIDHGFDSYINTQRNPLRYAYPLSLTAQIAAAGKRTVLLLPLNRVRWPELANLNDATQAVELFEEVQAAFLRFRGRHFWAPNLGRMALASFSAGIQELLRFHQAAEKSPLLRSSITETYVFDPIHSNGAQVSNYAIGLKTWAGKVAERRVRVYNNDSSKGHESFIGSALPVPPFVVDSADGRFTAGVVNDRHWFESADGADKYKSPSREDITSVGLSGATPSGATELPVSSSEGFSVGDTVVVAEDLVTRLVDVQPKKLTLAQPFRLEGNKDRTVIIRFVTTRETTVATDTLAGSPFLQVADAGLLFDGARIVIDDTEYHGITEVRGPVARVWPDVGRVWKTGTRVKFLDTAVHSTLREHHPAGATVLKVFAGQRQGFAAKMMVRIDFDEMVQLTDVGEDTLTIATPLAKDYPLGTQVAQTIDRKLFWGLYHAMFVAIFLTDAMRKSGFA